MTCRVDGTDKGGIVKRRFALLALVIATSAADAQIIRRPVRSQGPTQWVGFTAGLVQPALLHDGTTSSTWDFGSATEFRLSYEKVLEGAGSSFGVAGGYASAPLLYTGGNGGTVCLSGCDAKATVMQLLAIFHGGDGLGFHQAFELTGGATAYSGFKTTDNERLAPTKTDVDLSFSIGYGFGYGLSPTSSIEVVQAIGLSIHQKTGLAANESNMPRSSTTRISFRLGLGGRR
jgi:hypothetical protein